LYLNEQALDINDLVSYEALQKHAHQSNQPILQVLVLQALAAADAVRNVQVNELRGEANFTGSKAVYHFHGMEAHVHAHQRR